MWWSMEWRRASGREDERSDEGFTELTMVFRDGLEDFKVDLAADERNSSADVLRDDRSLFSIFTSCNFPFQFLGFFVFCY